MTEPEAFPGGVLAGNIFGLKRSKCHDALRLGLPMNQARCDKLIVGIDFPESEYASTNRFPSCEIPCPV